MSASTPKGLTSHTSLMLMARLIRARMSESLLMILAICNPAVLKDLEGELQVMELRWQASETEANGVKWFPGMISSQ